MFLLDTNVVSELRKAGNGKCHRNVSAWAQSVATSTMFLSVISVLELEVGVLLIERRDEAQGVLLRTWLHGQVLPAFSGRILNIDSAVATLCARLHLPKRRADRDAFIAATALTHGMTVVTHNIKDFQLIGVKLFDPWET